MLPKTGGLSKHIVGLGGGNGVTGADLKKQKKPPKGMYLNYQDLMSIASGPAGQGDAILKGLDSELCSLKRQVRGFSGFNGCNPCGSSADAAV